MRKSSLSFIVWTVWFPQNFLLESTSCMLCICTSECIFACATVFSRRNIFTLTFINTKCQIPGSGCKTETANRCTALLSKTDGKEMQCMPTHRTVFHIIMLCTWRLFPNFAHDNAVKICFDRKGRWILQGGLWVHSPLLEMWMCLREMCTCIAKGRGLSGWEWVKLYRCNGLRP